MIYQDLYWNAAMFYLAGVAGFWLVMWKLTRYISWPPLRWWLVWVFLCVVLTPWQGMEPEPYYAPAIIVAAFDFLDLGWDSAYKVLAAMINAIVLGSGLIVFVAIVLKIQNIKLVERRSLASEDAAEAD
ncbi:MULTISPECIES: hypothetical protein [Reinekea]|uniref:Conserved hypothetical membrane protein n=1 Tax=Reinekea forsetii TaxID=1336806 RepID=A0A2K8KR57_9GAMM|nr:MULTISPECIES: hypothetical protein [Reinekea]ATX77218.1 conserved hypothetical membrane protein [Reinekea forsetii]MDO7642287.1 hypothetical protein [Reinekea forsetii]MDO7645209.1 hypothetical protein [Reinekea forsetii]